MRAFHNSRDIAFRLPYGAIPLGTAVSLSIDLWDAPDARVQLRTWVDGVGEALYEMEPQSAQNGGEQTRYRARLVPESAGTVWYQFVIEEASGRIWRYGVPDGRRGGEGRLFEWEPPSFQLEVYDPLDSTPESDTVACTDGFPIEDILVGFLRGERSAYEVAESIETIRETRPHGTWTRAFSFVETDDCERLFVQLSGQQGEIGPHAGTPIAELLGERDLGLAKGRLWCACLVQMLISTAPVSCESERLMDELCARWETVDFDCGTIVRNASELRGALPPLESGATRCFAVNDDVLGIWRHTEDGLAACILINASLSNAHDVSIPFASEAVSEVISGYSVETSDHPLPACAPSVAGSPALDGANETRCALVHLYQLGSAILYFHPQRRLDRSLNPGMGVLAHITSLPRPTEMSCPADREHAFVDWLAQAGMRYWQVLPVNPTDDHGSPYAGISAFAGNVRLFDDIADPDDEKDVAHPENFDQNAYYAFCERESDWLEPYAAFMAIRRKMKNSSPWQKWPKKYRTYSQAAIDGDPELATLAESYRRSQFAFDARWRKLRAYANSHGIQIIGDMPIYVSTDSADVWAHPHLFQLDEKGLPSCVAGCPPDSFAAEGQIWGNPVYNWEALEAGGYDWWLRRLERACDLYDFVRLDHFIGFARYYSIPNGGKAVEGAYHPGPGARLFQAAFDRFGPLPLVAEDLGLITPAVRGLVATCGFPGMDIVQFADGGDPLGHYVPRPEKIVYSGTHDNRTLVGYIEERYPDLDGRETAVELLENIATCSASVCIVPLQDLLLLDDSARMNVPGTVEGNWAWKAEADSLAQALPLAAKLAQAHAAHRR